MRARVHRQRRALDEALGTVWKVASIRPFVRVYSVVSAEVRLAIEYLQTCVNQTVAGEG